MTGGMKTPNKTSYDVILHSGETVQACCGPAILALGDTVRGYVRSDDKVQCQNRGDIDRCPVSVMRAEAKKKTEQEITVLRAKASLLLEQADSLERRIK